jgi:hypothetical protein
MLCIRLYNVHSELRVTILYDGPSFLLKRQKSVRMEKQTSPLKHSNFCLFGILKLLPLRDNCSGALLKPLKDLYVLKLYVCRMGTRHGRHAYCTIT